MKEWQRTIAGRDQWPLGPWHHEPDKIQWVDSNTNFDCLMVRNLLGAWCGYVGVAQGHPWFGVSYMQCDADVHGGLTYSDFCQEGDDPAIGICHVPERGRPDHVWWLGFDCAHAGDWVPGLRFGPLVGDQYRDRAYVQAQVQCLAQQARAACQ